MSIWGNPVMMGGSGGSGGSNIYLLDSSKITAYLTALGQTPVTMFTGNVYHPEMICTFQTINEASSFVAHVTGFVYRENSWLTGIGSYSFVYPQLIPSGMYSKLCVEYYLNSYSTNPIALMGVGSCTFDSNNRFTMDILSDTIPVTTDPTQTWITRKLDISAVSQSFCFGITIDKVTLSIRNIWLE